MSKLSAQVIDLGERVLGTAAATAVGVIGVQGAFTTVNWAEVGDVSALAAIVTLLKGIVSLTASGTASAAGSLAASAQYAPATSTVANDHVAVLPPVQAPAPAEDTEPADLAQSSTSTLDLGRQ